MSFDKGNDSRDDLPLKDTGKKWNALTTYEPRFCDEIMRLSAGGCTIAMCSREMQVPYSTMRDWCRAHEDFALAYEASKILHQAYWESILRDNAVYFDHKDAPKRVVKDSLVLHALRCYFGQKDASATIGPDGSITTNDDRVIELAKKFMEEKL